MAYHTRPSGKAQQKIGRNIPVLCLWVVVACLYVAGLAIFGEFTRSAGFDGSLGMFLGLFICSFPAANGLDMLVFMTSDARERIIHHRSGQLWLALNVLTLLAGWTVIFFGALRFVAGV